MHDRDGLHVFLRQELSIERNANRGFCKPIKRLSGCFVASIAETYSSIHASCPFPAILLPTGTATVCTDVGFSLHFFISRYRTTIDSPSD